VLLKKTKFSPAVFPCKCSNQELELTNFQEILDSTDKYDNHTLSPIIKMMMMMMINILFTKRQMIKWKILQLIPTIQQITKEHTGN
jgi:hypothetical protein